MIALTYRNLLLFVRNRATAVFSVLGALIALVLYVVFLKSTITGNWSGAGPLGSHTQTLNNLLDPWLMGGMLSITGITTTLAGLSTMVRDKENGLDKDFLITCRSQHDITAAYLLSSAIIGFIVQIIVLLATGAFFVISDGITLPWDDMPAVLALLAVMVLNAVVGAILAYAFVSPIRRQSAASGLNTIVGTGAGFLAGVYIPIGTLPAVAQRVMKLWPGAYTSSLFRRILMNQNMDDAFTGPAASSKATFVKDLGIGYSIHGTTTTWLQEAVLFVATTCAIASVIFLVRWLVAHIRRLH